MEAISDLSQNDILTLIVSIAQIVGLLVAIFAEGPVVAVIMGIAGFAAVVSYFLPSRFSRPWYGKLRAASALCGIGLIILSIATVS